MGSKHTCMQHSVQQSAESKEWHQLNICQTVVSNGHAHALQGAERAVELKQWNQ